MTAPPEIPRVPQRDLRIWRGDDDPPLSWRFGSEATPDILRGSTFLLLVQFGREQIELRSEDAASTLVVDEHARSVTWAYTIAESSALPQGTARYELKRIIGGKTRTWVWGQIAILSGLRHV